MSEKNISLKQSTFYDRAKLLIVMSLASSSESLSFLELLEATQLTKGNLSSHLQKLEAEKFVKIHKRFVDKKPLTTIEVTEKGKAALKEHLDDLQKLIKKIKI